MRRSLLRSAAATLGVLALAGCGGTREATVAHGRDDGRFVPATQREGGRVVLPLTFTDDTRAELLYPPRLRLAELGLTPYGSGTLHGDSPSAARSDFVGRDFLIAHGELKPRPRHLDFRFGSWAVQVYDYRRSSAAAMTAAERAAWARSFSGWETADGFLRLEGTGPLRLARAGEHAGPELSLGSFDTPRSLTLYPGRCTVGPHHTKRVGGTLVNRSRGYANWCASPSMRVDARGDRRFLAALIRRLEVRGLDSSRVRP